MIKSWYSEITREPKVYLNDVGFLVCCYCGEILCFPVESLDLEKVARAHYGVQWRQHKEVTKGRQSL